MATALTQDIEEKLAQLMGKDGLFEKSERNERGELVNEEGLPIIDITEPLNKFAQGVTSLQAEEEKLVPLTSLPEAERARLKQERDRILDLLEAEEEIETAKNEEAETAKQREEIERRKKAVQGEMDHLKAAREMQKKMGKALLRNIAEVKEREQKPEELPEKSKSLKPKKSVSFAESNEPEVDTVNWGDVQPARLRAPTKRATLINRSQISTLPMKMDVVERTNTLPAVAPVLPVDSDDESIPPDSPNDSEDEEPPHPYTADDPSLLPRPFLHDSDQEEEPVLEEEYDLDLARHQREITLEYYEKRLAIGAETRQAMSAHSHEGDWDQEDVPLDATLAYSQPKPTISKFKANRLASKSIPSVIPSSSMPSLQHAVRVGKLEDGKLLGGAEGDSASEEDENMKEVLDLLRKGDVHNIGPDGQKTSLKTPVPVPAPAPSAKPKTSKFKVARSQAGRPAVPFISPSTTPISEAQRSSPKLPETTNPSASAGMMIIDSPSFPPRSASSSFIQEREPLSGTRLRQPPTIMSSAVRESLPGRAQRDADKELAGESKPGRKVSRFLAERG